MFIILVSKDLRGVSDLTDQKIDSFMEAYSRDAENAKIREANPRIRRYSRVLVTVVIILLIKVALIITGYIQDKYFREPSSFQNLLLFDCGIEEDSSNVFSLVSLMQDLEAELTLFFAVIIIVLTEKPQICYYKHSIDILKFWYGGVTMVTCKLALLVIYFC
jgi:hypothetical protein